MALEALLLSQQGCTRRFGCGSGAMAGWPWNGLFGGAEGTMEFGGAGSSWDAAACSSSTLMHGFQGLDSIPAAGAPSVACGGSAGAADVGQQEAQPEVALAPTSERRKRRRSRPIKNKEEAESQRMTHIAVERNRRKQMNEYLAALRALMPPSYAHRGDQASIVGGAINFVKELEQLFQSLEAQKRARQRPADDNGDAAAFANFFTFPQYSMNVAAVAAPAAAAPSDVTGAHDGVAELEKPGSKPSAVAEVEATMVESHANLRVLSRRRPRQLLRLVMGLQSHRLTVLHLNMTSSGHMVLYSFNLKVEDDCQLTCVDDIASAAHQILETIEVEQGCSLG